MRRKRKMSVVVGVVAAAGVIAAAGSGGGGDADPAAAVLQTDEAQVVEAQADASQTDAAAAKTGAAEEEQPRRTMTVRMFDPATGEFFDAAVPIPDQVRPDFGEGLNPDFLFLPLDATTTANGTPIRRDIVPLPVGEPWFTNWDVRIAEPDEFVVVLPRDSIRSLQDPTFDDITRGNVWLQDDHPVIQVEINGDARAFPLGIISKHEVVNTTIGGRALAVTFCPLCNTAIAFERVLEGQVVEFGVSGMLRNSDLVMWDRTTETLWQQLTGEALVGGLVGEKLELLSAPIISWGQFKDAFPEGLVLSVETGFPTFNYNLNSYVGYDQEGPFAEFFDEDTDPRLRANERVAAIELNDTRVAYSFEFLRQTPVVNATQGGEDIVVVWTPGTASALDSVEFKDAADVGATGVFGRGLDGRRLTFAPNPDHPLTFLDTDTGTVWDIFGRGVSGELAGSQLEVIVHGNHFWFAWAAFFPDTELIRLDA